MYEALRQRSIFTQVHYIPVHFHPIHRERAITPLPGATAMKPGSATRPFFGVEPAIATQTKTTSASDQALTAFNVRTRYILIGCDGIVNWAIDTAAAAGAAGRLAADEHMFLGVESGGNAVIAVGMQNLDVMYFSIVQAVMEIVIHLADRLVRQIELDGLIHTRHE